MGDAFTALFGEGAKVTHGRFGGNPVTKTDHTGDDIRRMIATHNQATRQKVILDGDNERGSTVESRKAAAIEFANHWNAKMKCDFAGYLEDLFAPFGDGFNAKMGITPSHLSITASSPKVQQLTRDYYFTQKNVHHSFFRLHGIARNTGHGAHFLGRSMDYYIHAGMKTADVSAALESGGYTWARYGFLPTSNAEWQSQAREVQTKLNSWVTTPAVVNSTIASKRNAGDEAVARKIESRRHLLLDGAVVAAFKAILDKPDRMAQWEAVDHPLGALIFPGCGFSGKIDLTDKKQMDRFEAYSKRGSAA